MRWRGKIRTLVRNINKVRTHEKELYFILKSQKPDVIILNKTRADVIIAINNIWPGSRVEKTLPIRKSGSATRAGTAVIVQAGTEFLLQEKIYILSEDKAELI